MKLLKENKQLTDELIMKAKKYDQDAIKNYSINIENRLENRLNDELEKVNVTIQKLKS